MIIGGVDAAARATSERAGYTTTYLPMSARVIPAAVKSAIEGNGVLQYHASARIRNVADNAWVDLSPVTYFQINLDNRGTQDSADVTIAQPETWSPYLAGVYADLLKPSTRVLQISCGITAGGTQYTQRIFRGHITEYQEPHGASGGSINLRLADVREALAREASTPLAQAAATGFRVFLHQQRSTQYFVGGAGSPSLWQTSVYRFNDIEVTDTTDSTNDGTNILRIMERMIPGAPLLAIRGNGTLVADLDGPGTGEIGGAFDYSDSNVISVTRTGGGGNFNAVRTYGLSGGVGTTSEVTDAADVALRGKIYYPAGLWGSPEILLTTANATAAEFLTASMRGKLSCEIPLNPFLEPGMRIAYDSTRLNLSGTARIFAVQHQYAVGRARTYLRDLQVVP